LAAGLPEPERIPFFESLPISSHRVSSDRTGNGHEPTSTPENATMASLNVLREASCAEGFCSLGCIAWLYRKIRGSFFLIVGSHTCQFFVQSALGVMVFSEPRFATAIIEEGDLAAKTADFAHIELDRIVGEIVKEYDPTIVFLVGTCPSEIIKVDLENIGEMLSEKYGRPVMFAPVSGLEHTFTQGEDGVLQALLQISPTPTPEMPRELVLVGAVADTVEDEILQQLKALDIPVRGVLPARDPRKLPAIGPNTVCVALQPYLSMTMRALKGRGAEVLSCRTPIGPAASRQFYETICRAFGKEPPAVLAELEAEAWDRIGPERQMLIGKRIAVVGDNLLELPIANLLNEMGAEIVELSTPYFNRKAMAADIDCLPDGLTVYEKPDVISQAQRVIDLKPDLTICGLGLANPFESKGLPTKWSIEFTFTPIHGFQHAKDLAEIIARPVKRGNLMAQRGWYVNQ
jgi:light-independent protochlorophyllide reductase subunit N